MFVSEEESRLRNYFRGWLDDDNTDEEEPSPIPWSEELGVLFGDLTMRTSRVEWWVQQGIGILTPNLHEEVEAVVRKFQGQLIREWEEAVEVFLRRRGTDA